MNALEQVLLRLASDARALKQYGHGEQARAMEHIIAEVRYAARDYLAWIPESEAVERSGHSVEWLRARRNAWREDGLAEKHEEGWFYCKLVIPKRATTPRLEAVRAEAKRLAAKHRGGAR